MAQEFKRPEFIEGGCLCNSVRWRISFPPGTEYPPGSAHCHCTMCRKSVGAFVATFFPIEASQVTWVSKSNFKEYASSDNARRGFCGNCGGSISWRQISDEKRISLFASLIDEEILHDKQLGVLKNGKESYFCKNMLPGIDDGIKSTTAKNLEFGPETIKAVEA